tara:strand:- start:29 stop:841 length:813 start_codon:yes stop_codon:yes gene_type:complete
MGFSDLGFSPPQGGVSGFQPSQGSGGAVANPILADILWWFTFAGGGPSMTDSVSGLSLTAVNTPTAETGPAGTSNTAMGLTTSASNYVESTDAYFRETAEGTGGSGGLPFTLVWWIYPGYGVTPWLKSNTDQWSMTKYPASGGTWYCGVKGNGGSWRNAVMTTAIADSAWHFLSYRYYGHGTEVDGSASASANGKRVNLVTGTAGSGAIAQTGTENCCGESMTTGAGLSIGGSGTANGRIAMAGRWNRVLTDLEVLEVYDTTLAGGGYPF